MLHGYTPPGYSELFQFPIPKLLILTQLLNNVDVYE